jgi:hypothetical protein
VTKKPPIDWFRFGVRFFFGALLGLLVGFVGGGVVVAGTSYQWHIFSDGQATYRTDDGGFILGRNASPAASGDESCGQNEEEEKNS